MEIVWNLKTEVNSYVDIDNKVDIIYTVCVIERVNLSKESHKGWYRLCLVCVKHRLTEVIDML